MERGTARIRGDASRWIVYGSILTALGLFVMCNMARMPEANARMRRAQAKAGMRTLAVELEHYREKHGDYPEMRSLAPASLTAAKRDKTRMEGVTTWNAELAGPIPADPFSPGRDLPFAYHTDRTGWIAFSPGPDGRYDLRPETFYKIELTDDTPGLIDLTYDPTNGSFSAGDIWRMKQSPVEPR